MNLATQILSGFTILEPLLVPLVADLRAILTKHPTMTADQLTALVQTLAPSIHAINADTISTIAADQAEHPPTP